jgi:hypothetical protein
MERSQEIFLARVNSIAAAQITLMARITGCAAMGAEDKCCCHEFGGCTATWAKALANKATIQRHHKAAVREKALADKANKQCRAAARDKAFADKANKQRRYKAATCSKSIG